MNALLLLVLIAAILLALPFLVLVLVVDLGLWLLGVPFRLLAAVLGLLGGLLAAAAAVVASGLGLGLVLVLLVGGLLILPLLPLVVVGVAVWLLTRRARQPDSVRARL